MNWRFQFERSAHGKAASPRPGPLPSFLARRGRKLRRGIERLAIAGFVAAIGCLLFSGCATSRQPTVNQRAFDFEKDTFAYANELKWEYSFGTNGQWTWQKRMPPPDYALHCFAMARAARDFFAHAKFVAAQPQADEATYRTLIWHVLRGDEVVEIPGYANLREFSAAQEKPLKGGCGGAWRSYFQRGNWRITFPFSRRHQEKMAARIAAELKRGSLPVIHLSRFPKLNHAMLVFGSEESEKEIRFTAYDPNQPEQPTMLTFNRTSREFVLPRNTYFAGGRVEVYEIYRNLIY